MTPRRLLAGVFVAMALVAAHWFYWYAPRERPARPHGGTLSGRIYLESELPHRLWLPYPHQNLARLEGSIGRLDRVLREVGRLSGETVPQLPAFGAARLPPSTALVLATDESGERFVVAADIYPLVGLLARWAGRLAGNPLLAGGRSRIGDHTVEVRWRDGVWLLASRGMEEVAPVAADAAGRLPAGRALAWLRLERDRGRVPAGDYRLDRRGDDLELWGGDAERLEALRRLAGRAAPLPLVRAEALAGPAGGSSRAFALLPGLESLGGLPGAVAVHRGGAPFRLPGERLAELVGDGVRELESGGWSVRALDRGSLARGVELAGFAAELEAERPLAPALWLDLRSAERLVEQVVAALEAVPIVGRREARRWRLAGDLLARFSAFERLTVLISPAPAALHVELHAADTEPSD